MRRRRLSRRDQILSVAHVAELQSTGRSACRTGAYAYCGRRGGLPGRGHGRRTDCAPSPVIRRLGPADHRAPACPRSAAPTPVDFPGESRAVALASRPEARRLGRGRYAALGAECRPFDTRSTTDSVSAPDVLRDACPWQTEALAGQRSIRPSRHRGKALDGTAPCTTTKRMSGSSWHESVSSPSPSASSTLDS
jgi:hypothetical protein